MNRAARRDYVVGAEPSHYSRPDLWEEGVNQIFFCHSVTPTKETAVLCSGSFLLETVSALPGLADGSKHK